MDCSKVICCREYDSHSVGEGVKSPAEKVRLVSPSLQPTYSNRTNR
jgi:hypothetical protein